MTNFKLICFILFLGFLFRIILTSGGNFLFNMDNARDMVDVREMVVLPKARLTGPTSAIDGFFNGPAWYYLIAGPFILSGGDPYASIIMEIILWAIGGFFLLRLVSRWSKWLILPIGALWVASDYVVLTNLYAFNPNLVILLTPLFIYLLVEYLKTGKVIFAILTGFLAGLFFNFEMNIGVFLPAIILMSIIFTKKLMLLKSTGLWLGAVSFILTLFPQIIFDLKHQFIMSKSILAFISKTNPQDFNIFSRIQTISLTFFNSFSPTLMNHKLFTFIILGFFIALISKKWKIITNDRIVVVCLATVFVPFIGYLFLPVTVNAWHLGTEMAVGIILIGFLLKEIWNFNIFGKLISLIFTILIIFFALSNIINFFLNDFGKSNLDPSLFRNEIAAIDYVYKYAMGKNFKVYTYLPSVIDYPYQYLIWWYGLKKYGYLPIDYAYAPEKYEYISNKKRFSATEEDIKKRENSNLVFLIKEPNRNFTLYGWEGDLIKYNWESLKKVMIGSIEVEIRKE